MRRRRGGTRSARPDARSGPRVLHRPDGRAADRRRASASSLRGPSIRRVRRTRKRPKEPYRTATPTPLPSKLGPVAAAPSPTTSSALRPPRRRFGNPVRRSLTGPASVPPAPSGKTNHTGQPRRATTDLSTRFGRSAAKLSTIHRRRGQRVDRMEAGLPRGARPGRPASERRSGRHPPGKALTWVSPRRRRPRGRNRPAQPRGVEGSGPRRSRSWVRRTRR